MAKRVATRQDITVRNLRALRKTIVELRGEIARLSGRVYAIETAKAKRMSTPRMTGQG